MKVCAISFVECWQADNGAWMAAGGFPRQMTGIASLFDEMDLVVVGGEPRAGGNPLPARARIIALKKPGGTGARRKLSVAAQLPYYAGTMLRYLREADAVHVPLPGDLPLIGMALALLSRRKLLARYGGSWHATSETTMMNRVTRALMRRFAGGPNIMLATGGGAGAPAPRMEWIFSTALTEAEIAGIHPRLDRGLAERPELVYCGRLSPEKGLPVLFEALAILRGRGLAPRLTLMGDGPQRAELEALRSRLGLQDAIRFLGQLNREELSTVFLRSDLCVQPSLSEGFSKAWIDAMAHGVPVIASRVGAAEEVMGGGQTDSGGLRGWLVVPGDAQALASRLESVLTGDLDWPALRLRCRRYAESLTVERWQAAIGEICSRRWNFPLREGRLTA